jgi:hypothetical protein
MTRPKRLSWARFGARSDTHRLMRSKFEQMRRALNAILNESEGVDFTADEREILAHDLHRLRTRLDELQQAIGCAK